MLFFFFNIILSYIYVINNYFFLNVIMYIFYVSYYMCYFNIKLLIVKNMK